MDSMSRSTFSYLLGVAVINMSLAIPVKASLQTNTPALNNDSEILVLGDKQRKSRVSDFIKTIIKPSKGDQYASFQGKICPVALGLPEDHGRVVEQRMLAVAAAANIKAGKADCQANMAVVVVNDPQDFFAELRREYPQILDGIAIAERNRLINGPGPAYAWQAVAMRGANGYNGADTGAIMGLGGAEQRGNAIGTTFTTSTSANKGARSRSVSGANSRLKRSVRFDINLAVMLVHKHALEGVTLRQLGDYSLMRLLGHTQDVQFEDIHERSILSLFTDRADDFDPPESVTAWDMAFMKSLYKTRGAKSAARQRSAMAPKFEKELVKWAEQAATN